MKILFSLYLLLVSSLYALSLDEIISKALDKNPSLASINHRISASDSRVDASNQFANPSLAYSQNTIDSSQAMSKKTITLSQKLPFLGKRDALEGVALAQKDVLGGNLALAKVSLVKAIKIQAYSIWELEEQYKIISDYEELTKQNIKLYESYSSTSGNQHMGIMSAELTLSDLKIQKRYLEAKISSAYAKLSYFSAFEIKKIDIDLVIMDLPKIDELLEFLINNKSLEIRDKEIKEKELKLHSADLNNYPDLNILASYSYRENFDDYLTIGIGASLPIYASEDYKEEEARKLILASKSLKEDTKIEINTELKSAYAQMKSTYEVYHIVHDEAIPQVLHMFELTSSSIATGGDLFKYIDNLIKKLKLEQQSITAIASYNRAEAKIEALWGEIQ